MDISSTPIAEHPFRDPGCPYDDLYIYYLDGIVPPDAFSSEKTFIGNWREDRCSFLFFSKPSPEAVDVFLKHQPHLTLLDQFHFKYENWQGKDLAPFQIGALHVVPCWLQEDVNDNSRETELTLILDPGVVFGSGAHPTTLDCLRALNRLFEKETPSTVLDLGTGTGLLAMVAAKLGSKKILAVDLNPLAAKTARRNFCINRMEDKILAIQGDAEDFIDVPSDLMIANIHFDVMKRLINAESIYQKKWLLLSGLMRSEANSLLQGFMSHRFTVIGSWIHEGTWHTYLMKNRACAVAGNSD